MGHPIGWDINLDSSHRVSDILFNYKSHLSMRNFIGNLLISVAAFLSFLRNILFFTLTIGICLGILMITIVATFEAFHLIQPTDFVPEYGRQLDIFAKDIWAWVVAGLGWVTMIYAANKLLIADNKESKRAKNKEYLF